MAIGTFREWLNEKEGKETYKEFFNKKLEKYGVKSATELSGDDKKKFFDEVDAEWKGAKEEPEDNDVNESIFNVPSIIKYLEDVYETGKVDKKVIKQCISVLSKI